MENNVFLFLFPGKAFSRNMYGISLPTAYCKMGVLDRRPKSTVIVKDLRPATMARVAIEAIPTAIGLIGSFLSFFQHGG